MENVPRMRCVSPVDIFMKMCTNTTHKGEIYDFNDKITTNHQKNFIFMILSSKILLLQVENGDVYELESCLNIKSIERQLLFPIQKTSFSYTDQNNVSKQIISFPKDNTHKLIEFNKKTKYDSEDNIKLIRQNIFITFDGRLFCKLKLVEIECPAGTIDAIRK